MRELLVWFIVGILLGVGIAFVWTAGAADVNGPFVPRVAQLILDVPHDCPDGSVYAHAYATKPLAEARDFDLVIIGRLGEHFVHELPTLYKWYAPGLANVAVVDAYLTLPGQPVRHMTDEEIDREFPHPCAVGHVLAGQPFRSPATQ